MGGNYSDFYGFYNGGGGGAFTTSLSNNDRRVILNRLSGCFYVNFRIGGMLSGSFHFNKLKEIGIEKENITLWIYYEYEQECNFEFHPKELQRIADFGIVLGISC